MKIGFLTVNYHSDQDTLNLINQLEKCIVPKDSLVKVYVVDNDRSISLKDSLRKHKSAVYLESPGNVGFAAGNNIGLRKIIDDKFDVVIMINNDTLVPKNFVSKILDSDIHKPDIGIVGGLIYFAKGYEYEKGYADNERGKVIWYGGGKIDWDNVYIGHDLVNEVDKGKLTKIDTPFVTGCLMIIRTSVLKKVGIFDEKYCLYLEDADLCERIKQEGFRLVFDPSIKIWHKVAQGSGIGSPLNDYFLTRNRLLFGFTYTGLRTKFALLREAIKKLFTGTKAQKKAVKDFIFSNYGWGSWKK